MADVMVGRLGISSLPATGNFGIDETNKRKENVAMPVEEAQLSVIQGDI